MESQPEGRQWKWFSVDFVLLQKLAVVFSTKNQLLQTRICIKKTQTMRFFLGLACVVLAVTGLDERPIFGIVALPQHDVGIGEKSASGNLII